MKKRVQKGRGFAPSRAALTSLRRARFLHGILLPPSRSLRRFSALYDFIRVLSIPFLSPACPPPDALPTVLVGFAKSAGARAGMR